MGEAKQVLQRWTESFTEQLNEEIEEEEERQDKRNSETRENIGISDNITEPTNKEIEGMIKRAKTNKAPGEDGLTIELIKHADPQTKEEICKLIKQIWKEEEMPTEWRIRLLCPIHKKRDKNGLFEL